MKVFLSPLQVSALRTLNHTNIVKFRDWCAVPLSRLTLPWRQLQAQGNAVTCSMACTSRCVHR